MSFILVQTVRFELSVGEDICLAVSHIQAEEHSLIFPFPTSVLHLQCPGLSFFYNHFTGMWRQVFGSGKRHYVNSVKAMPIASVEPLAIRPVFTPFDHAERC